MHTDFVSVDISSQRVSFISLSARRVVWLGYYKDKIVEAMFYHVVHSIQDLFLDNDKLIT